MLPMKDILIEAGDGSGGYGVAHKVHL